MYLQHISEKDTRVSLSTATRDRLKERKRGGETYEEVIENLLDANRQPDSSHVDHDIE